MPSNPSPYPQPGLAPYESQFEARLDALDRDSKQAAIFAYTQAALDYVASDFDLRDRLDEQAPFWNGIAGALQAASFIALGRIFDDDKKTHNASDLLRFAEDHRGIFSRAAIEARKMKAGLSADAARQYSVESYELHPGGLAALRSELQKRQEFYRDKAAPIRHKVFAHAGKLTRAERDKLFTGLFRRPLEDLIVFTLRLHEALWQLYHNGREPVLSDAPSNIGDVMKALPDRGTNTWEHLHAAREVADFLETLKRMPLRED